MPLSLSLSLSLSLWGIMHNARTDRKKGRKTQDAPDTKERHETIIGADILEIMQFPMKALFRPPRDRFRQTLRRPGLNKAYHFALSPSPSSLPPSLFHSSPSSLLPLFLSPTGSPLTLLHLGSFGNQHCHRHNHFRRKPSKRGPPSARATGRKEGSRDATSGFLKHLYPSEPHRALPIHTPNVQETFSRPSDRPFAASRAV